MPSTEKRKRKRKEKSKEVKQRNQSSKNVDTKKKRGSAPARKKVKDMTDEEKKKYREYQKALRMKQMERSNIKQLGLGEDQCHYIKELFSSLQAKAEGTNSPNHEVQKDTIIALDNLRECAISKLLEQANYIQRGEKNRTTFNARVALNAIRLSVPGDIVDHIWDRGLKALQRYKSSKTKDDEEEGEEEEYDTDQDDEDEDDEKKPTRGGINALSGLSLNVNRVIKDMRAICTFSRFSPDAAILITTALQVILEKIILLTLLYVARRNRKSLANGGDVSKDITARDVRGAVEEDGFETCGKPEDVETHFTRTGFSTFFANATWSQVGTRRKEISV